MWLYLALILDNVRLPDKYKTPGLCTYLQISGKNSEPWCFLSWFAVVFCPFSQLLYIFGLFSSILNFIFCGFGHHISVLQARVLIHCYSSILSFSGPGLWSSASCVGVVVNSSISAFSPSVSSFIFPCLFCFSWGRSSLPVLFGQLVSSCVNLGFHLCPDCLCLCLIPQLWLSLISLLCAYTVQPSQYALLRNLLLCVSLCISRVFGYVFAASVNWLIFCDT